MTSKLAYLGVALVVLGGAFLLTPSFGFETIASERPTDVGTASDENATVGFEPTGEDLDNGTDSATLFWLRNNAGQELSLANTIWLSISDLAVLDEGEGTVAPGGATSVSVDCGDYGGSDSASLTATIDTADGETITVTGASSVTSFLADCAVPAVVWETDADWNAGAQNRTVSDAVGDREADTVRLGYNATDPRLVSYWPLDEDTGSTVLDATGPNDGSASGGYALDRRGLLNSSGFHSDGTGTVEVPDDPSLRLQGDLTVSFWVRTGSLGSSDNADDQTFFVQKANYGYDGYEIIDNGRYTDEIVFRVYGENDNGDGSTYGVAFSRTLVNDSTWHHVVGVREGSAMRLYLDGEQQASRSDSFLDTNTTSLSMSGTPGGDGSVDGDLEEVRIYNRSLSGAEVRDLYETSAGGTHTTDWRSVDGTFDADRLLLRNVSASIADTEATVTVESDTDGDGAAEETSDPIALADGASGYDVTGLASDADRVRLHVELATSNVSRTPILSRAVLAERPYFDVTIDGTNEPVTEGETLTVDATVENQGTVSDTQTVELEAFDGTTEDSATLSLNASETTSVALEWTTQDGDAGTGEVNVTGETDYDTASVTVQEPANVTVAIDRTNSPVAVGDSLRVDATVTNDGGATDTQTIALGTDGTQRDSTSVSLEAGASASVALNWSTTADDVGIYDATVASDDDSAATEVSVYDPDGPIWETDADWNAGAQNRTVSDAVGDRQADTVRLGYNTTDSRLVSYWPFDEDPGAASAADVVGGNDGDVGGVAPGGTGLLNTTGYRFDGSSQVNVSDDASLQLQGDFAVSFWLYADGTLGTSDGVNGKNETFFLDKGSYGTAGYQLIDNGDYVDPSSAIKFRVHDGSAYQVNLPRSDVNDGQWHHLAGVREGDEIRLYLDGESRANTSPTGVTASTENLSIGGSELGDRHLDGRMEEVRIYNRSLSDTEVRQLARTAENGTHVTDWRPTGDPLNASSVGLVNVSTALGGANATVYVESDTDHDGLVDETSDPVVLSGDGSQENVAGLATDPDRVRLRIEFETANVSRTPIVSRIGIAERTNFDVTIDGTDGPVLEGETLTVDATVENTGQREGTQTIELRDFGGATVDEANVTLSPGENASLQFAWDTQRGDNGTANVTVASGDDAASRQVTVEQYAYFDVAVDSTNSPVVEGENLTVNASVTNEGDYADEQTVELRAFDGGVVDATEVALDAGQTNGSIALTWQTEVGDNGTDDVTVASDNTTDAREVTVETPGPVTATDVSPDVQSGGETQYVEFEITESMATDHIVRINLSTADNDAAMDYTYTDGDALTVVEGASNVQSAAWRDYGTGDLTGPRVRLDSPTTGDTVRIAIEQYSTGSSGGPWTVTFDHRGDDTELWTDDFRISG